MIATDPPHNFRYHGPDADGNPALRLPDCLLELCRKLRQEGTPPEQALWQLLRSRQLLGLKFRRQHVVGRYVVDFYCHEVRLVVELDGAPHEEERQAEYDVVRGRDLEGMGLMVLRFRNEELQSDVEGLLRVIAESALRRLPSPPAPLPEGEGRTTSTAQGDAVCR